MRKIIYVSNTGHAEKYALMLGDKLNIEALPISKLRSIEKDCDIIFISWVFASTINRLNDVLKDYNVICVIAVGMNKKSEANSKLLMDTNKLEKPFFYLQGGLDYKKLKGIRKFLIKMVADKVIKDNKPQDKELIQIFKEGGNFVSEDNLEEVYSYLLDNIK